MNGVLLVDKPKGITSFDVVRKVQRLSHTKKVGHAGTLDPLASGLMIICLGQYTKLAGYLALDHKTYDAQVTLGIATTTDDAEGEVLAHIPTAHLQPEQIQEACTRFLGRIEQLPPKFSAKKIKGQRAYRLARAEQEFTLSCKSIQITDFTITRMVLPDVWIRVSCSSGTYIRSIARDLGANLAVGGFAREIRRISSGGFVIEQAIPFEDLCEDSLMKTMLTGRKALEGLTIVEIDENDKENLRHGRKIAAKLQFSSDHAVACHRDELVAILQNKAGEISSVRGFES